MMPATARSLTALLCALVIACGDDDGTAPAPLSRVDSPADLTVNTPEFAIATTAADEESVSLATDGTNALVAYDADLVPKARLVSPSGTVLATINTRQMGTIGHVAYGASKYLMTWWNLDQVNVWALMITPGGAAIGAPFPVTNELSAPEGVAFAGGNFFITYGTSDGKTKGRIVHPDKSLGAATVITPSGFAGAAQQSLATDGTGFLATYTFPDSGFNSNLMLLYARRIALNGTVSAPVLISHGVVPGSVGVGGSTTGYLVAYSKLRPTTGADVLAQRVAPAGTLSGSAITIDASLGRQIEPMVTRYGDSGGFFVNWMAPANGSLTTRGIRVSSAGSLVGARQTYFKTDASNAAPLAIPVALDTRIFFVVNRIPPGSGEPNWDIRGAVITP
jgi:hypothetical protein